jgi:hypothetical protein
MSDKDKPMFPAMGSTGDLKRDIWNEAIEAAAIKADEIENSFLARNIRALKKSA